ncbi:MAG: hypothetical protein EA383_17905 [Spirochaetaceae bacterium]|nr:MAG: hypothetical protein EA383_17905 [Spirochaetaceae bacterium]
MSSNTPFLSTNRHPDVAPFMDSAEVFSLLRETSRTFSLSIEGLPASLKDEIAVSYLLFRVSDYLEDHETISPKRKIALLERWDEVLEDEAELKSFLNELDTIPHRPNDPEAEVAYRSGSLLMALKSFPQNATQTIHKRVRETTRGMAKWQAKGPRVEDEAEMDDYMHYVAGIVGYLVTDLFAQHSRGVARRRDTLMPLAREFGLALQTVNILRGLRKDYDRGWIFVPRTFCSSHGLTPSELFSPDARERALHVVEELVEKAERHLMSGVAYIRLIPRHLHRLRLACMWPLLFAAKTVAVSRNNPLVLSGEVKIGRDAVKKIMRDSAIWGWSNAWLSSYTRKLLTSSTI